MAAVGTPSEGFVSRRSPLQPGAARSDGDADSDASSSAHAGDQSDRKDVDILTQVLSNRSEEYRLMFRLPSDEVLLQDFNCALQENILLQGHMYLFIHHICFYSNIFGFETKKTIPFHEVTCVRKAKTVAIFPNAIEIVAGGKKHFFGSFLSRDEAYRLIIDGWVQHGGDITAMDIKSEASNQENSVYERVQGCKALSDDGSSSNRGKDASVLEEIKPMSNGEVENKENGGKENAHGSSSHFIWTIEDLDAPSVPEHFTMIAESKFPVLLEDFFDLFVSDDAVGFLKDFHGRCGDKDFQCTSWRNQAQFGHTRNVSFLHPVKVYIGARFGNCQEVQKFRVYRNSHLVIETSQNILDVPYGDYFEVQGTWDVVQDNGKNSCTVKVYSHVAFSKKTMFRGKIEQSTREECREVYATWISCAHEVLKEKNIGLLRGLCSKVLNIIKFSQGCICIYYLCFVNIFFTRGNYTFAIAAGISEQKTCVVLENDNEFGSHPELERSMENPTSNSANTIRNIHETTTDSNLVIDKTMKEKSEQSVLMSIFRESWETLLSHIRTQSLFPLVLAVAFVLFILMQLSIILLLTRAPEVHLVSNGNYMSEANIYSVEHIEWLEKRVNYLKEEMLMLEARMERMRHEYDLLKSYIRSLEQLKAKS